MESSKTRRRSKQEEILLALTLLQLRNLASKLGVAHTVNDSKPALVARLMDEGQYPPDVSPRKTIMNPANLSALLLLPYWKSPAGVDKRISDLAQDFAYKTVGTTMEAVAGEQGYALRWVVHPELSKTGPCPECQANSERGDYDDTYGTNLGSDVYSPHGDLPEYPAHNGCVCEWEILYEEET